MLKLQKFEKERLNTKWVWRLCVDENGLDGWVWLIMKDELVSFYYIYKILKDHFEKVIALIIFVSRLCKTNREWQQGLLYFDTATFSSRIIQINDCT